MIKIIINFFFPKKIIDPKKQAFLERRKAFLNNTEYQKNETIVEKTSNKNDDIARQILKGAEKSSFLKINKR